MPNVYFIFITVFIILIIVYIVVTYNNLVSRRNMVENQKSQIDIELQRRFDLIPNLVEIVKGYAKHEQKTLEDVVKARNSYIDSSNDTHQALAADGALTGALTRLFALVENYPELKANTSFMNLQKELSETEKKIAFSRQFYNDSVYKLNTKIDVFPSNLIAMLFKFKKQPFFQTTDNERKNVKIEL